jgi:5-methylcytosine-specific restriction endonuclease McrA
MQNHTKVYLTHFNLSEGEYVPCEMCSSKAVDIHHIIPRSKFGKKRKDEQDLITNLIALCRDCHDLAHSTDMKEELTIRHLQRISNYLE